jgi:hypothetical protein
VLDEVHAERGLDAADGEARRPRIAAAMETRRG